VLELLFLLEKPRHKVSWYHRWENGYLREVMFWAPGVMPGVGGVNTPSIITDIITLESREPDFQSVVLNKSTDL